MEAMGDAPETVLEILSDHHSASDAISGGQNPRLLPIKVGICWLVTRASEPGCVEKRQVEKQDRIPFADKTSLGSFVTFARCLPLEKNVLSKAGQEHDAGYSKRDGSCAEELQEMKPPETVAARS